MYVWILGEKLYIQVLVQMLYMHNGRDANLKGLCMYMCNSNTIYIFGIKYIYYHGIIEDYLKCVKIYC